MKLRLLMIVVFLLFPLTAVHGLPPALPHSVCDHKKTSLTGWLPSTSPSAGLPSRLFFSPRSHFPAASLSLVAYANSK